MAKRIKPVLRVRVSGPNMRSGRIPVPELIKLCEEAQKAVIRQAEAIEGRKTIHPGPATAAIRNDCTLELIGLKSGSTTLEFGFARPQIKIDETLSVGSDAIAELTRTIKILSNGTRKQVKEKALDEINDGVLHGIMALGRAAKSKGITTLQLISPAAGRGKPQIIGTVNETVTSVVARRLSRPRRAIVTVVGYLEMADFKPRDRRCRIEPAIGVAINCTFSEQQENAINALIRKPVRITGEATYPPNSERIDVIRITTIEPLPSLEVGEGNFFSNTNLDELADLQNVRPLKDPSKLVGGFPADEDVDAFLKDIYESRK